MSPAELKELAESLTTHMVAKGVHSVKLGASEPHQAGGSWHLELELDPAAQYLGAGDTQPPREAKPKPAGECPVVGCEKPGGHMGQRWCAGHFGAALRGQLS